jgi:hypothetical protein
MKIKTSNFMTRMTPLKLTNPTRKIPTKNLLQPRRRLRQPLRWSALSTETSTNMRRLLSPPIRKILRKRPPRVLPQTRTPPRKNLKSIPEDKELTRPTRCKSPTTQDTPLQVLRFIEI